MCSLPACWLVWNETKTKTGTQGGTSGTMVSALLALLALLPTSCIVSSSIRLLTGSPVVFLLSVCQAYAQCCCTALSQSGALVGGLMRSVELHVMQDTDASLWRAYVLPSGADAAKLPEVHLQKKDHCFCNSFAAPATLQHPGRTPPLMQLTFSCNLLMRLMMARTLPSQFLLMV